MGIPGFFGWLLRKYDKNTFTAFKLNTSIDELYIDANCMLHPSCFKILKNALSSLSNEKLEDEMITMCLRDLDYLIKYVNPTKQIFIAVDGVAPLAKISQQRKRRYKSYDETQRKNIIKQKYGVSLPHSWTNASITPGTIFMEKLHRRIIAFLKELPQKCQIIYSSYHTAGEGEHKIFAHIRKEKHIPVTRVIYGLDADLIFLAMACNTQKLFLIREETEFKGRREQTSSSQHDVFTYVSIDTLINCFNEQVFDLLVNRSLSGTPCKRPIQKNNTNDIIFICYFLGNDFVPHVPSIDIKKYGMDMLLDAYGKAYMNNTSSLINYNEEDTQVNVLFLNDFLSYLVTSEKDYFTKKEEIAVNRIQHFESPCDEELWKLDNMKIIKSSDIFQKHIGTFDDWKFRYYSHHFHTTESQEITIRNICKNYIDGIMWITKYYFNGCQSWNWVYEYQCAPFVSDLNKFMQTYHYNVNELQFELGQPIPAVIQLLCVIPKQYSYLLPDKYAELMNDTSSIGDMFPSNYILDTCNKDQFWQCNPILPILNMNRILNTTQHMTVIPYIEIINKILQNIVFTNT